MPKSMTRHLAGWCKTCRVRAIWKSSKTCQCWWCDSEGKAAQLIKPKKRRN